MQKLRLLFTCLLCLIVLSSGGRNSRNMRFSHITSEQGLDSDECNFVFQDQEGFIWIGTRESLFRYDGYDLINFEDIVTEGRLGKANFIGMVEDGERRLWISSSLGIVCYDKKSNRTKIIYPTDASGQNPPSYSFRAIEYDRSGKIWFGGPGIYVYDLATEEVKFFRSISPKDKLRGVRDILCGKSGDIWIATWGGGLGRFNHGTNRFDQFKIFNNKTNPKLDNVICSLEEDDSGNLWVGTWDNGLYVVRMNGKGSPEITKRYVWNSKTGNSILGNIIYDMEEDGDGNLWVGTPYGLSILKNGLTGNPEFVNFRYISGSGQLSNNEVLKIMKDRTGQMWIATLGGGINRVDINKNVFSTYFISEVDSLRKSQSVNSFTYDPKGRLLVGVRSLGFGAYDLAKRKFIHYKVIPDYAPLEVLDINTVKNFTWDHSGNLWLGCRFMGLIKYNLQTGEYHRFGKRNAATNEFLFHEVSKVVADSHNNIWFNAEGAIYRVEQGPSGLFDDNQLTAVLLKDSKSQPIPSPCTGFNMDQDGYIYLVTNNGKLWKSDHVASRHAKEVVFHELSRTQNRNLIINTVFIDKNNRIWLGTNKGVEIYTQEDSVTFLADLLNNVNNLSVYSIVQDNKGNIWASSNKGICFIDMALPLYPHFSHFTVRNGLQESMFIKEAIYQDTADHIYFGGHKGFNQITPEDIADDTVSAKVVLTNIKTSDTEYFNVKNYTKDNPFLVRYNDNMISISFASLDYRESGSISYSYRLEGIDNKWKHASAQNRTVTYANLKPGDYSFSVRVANSNGKWSETSLPIHVETAPYYTWWACSLYFILVSGIVFLIFSMYLKQRKIKEALRIESIEKSKSEKLSQFKLQFFTNISHELLNPLSVLIIVAKRLEDQFKDENEHIRILSGNVRNLHRQIKQMLYFRKAETGNMELNLADCNLSSLIKEVSENYIFLAQDKNIRFETDIEDEITGTVDFEKIKICISNFLSNAIKYTPPEGKIMLKASRDQNEEGDWADIAVCDTGIGISKENINLIFGRFYRLASKKHFEDGIGIGLALTKHLVEIQGGKIQVESELNKGTSFRVRIPLQKAALPEGINPFVIDDRYIDLHDDLTDNRLVDEVRFSGKCILVVEDNPDFLYLLQQHLRKYFNVLSATNGEDALKITNEREIDLIVSDIMMPRMDGYEFCKRIKSEVNTSHVPFIMITARTEDRERLIGYESGADSYLTKPLNMDVLVHRIDSLLKLREKITSDFSNGVYLEPKKIVTTPIDEKILLRAKEVVETYIAETDFSVKTLCDELSMSNSMLYRKIKGLLNLTPNEFIRNIRLRKAAQLMEDRGLNISEIAYQTGFSDLSYFGACFKKQYGISPSAYQKGYTTKSPKQPFVTP